MVPLRLELKGAKEIYTESALQNDALREINGYTYIKISSYIWDEPMRIPNMDNTRIIFGYTKLNEVHKH